MSRARGPAGRPGAARNGTASTKALASQERSDCEWRRSKNYYRYTRVGQLHQWGGFRSTFYYASGSQADSEIGAAVAYGRAGFEARGETSVTKTTVGERGSIIRPPGPGAFSRYVQTRFLLLPRPPRQRLQPRPR